MKIVRPIAESDFDALKLIAEETGIGFTSLPKEDEALMAKIQRSVQSFSLPIERLPDNPLYLFVLEDLVSNQVIGISAIEAKVGRNSPLYHFRRSSRLNYSASLNVSNNVDSLSLCTDYTGATEVCSLYIRPAFRESSLGKLLSKTRFLFIAEFKQRFSELVIAQMRGYTSDNGESPFYQWLNRTFLPVDFNKVDHLVGLGDKQFISEMMPSYQIPTCLLPEQASAVVGRVHCNTEPALRMLKKEGFRNRGYFDLFDAGPTIEASAENITTIRDSHVAAVSITPELDVNAERILLATSKIQHYRGVITQAVVHQGASNTVSITRDIAKRLGVVNEEEVRICKM